MYHTVQVVANRSQAVQPLYIVTQRQCFDGLSPKAIPCTGRVGIRQDYLILVANCVRAEFEF